MFKFIKKLFGTKYDRDEKHYMPYVNQTNAAFEQLRNYSNDQLRNRTLEFRTRIAEHLSGIDEDILSIKEQAKAEKDLQAKEALFKDLDDLQKERDKHLEEILKEILPEAFAVVKETARRFMENETLTVTTTDHDRELAGNPKKGYLSIQGDQTVWQNKWMAAGAEITWNMLHYDVQLIGGMVLHDGKIAEMATGEGKTLVATLPAYLNGLAGQGVHVITVNDYLARRDSEWIGPIFEFLLMTIDCIDKYKPHSPGRKAAYNCDITYGTNNEFGFDYLRDNMVRSQDEMVQGKHHYTMIDEVDSVLIDDARTPLIISGPVPKGNEEQEYEQLKGKVERLIAAQKQLATGYLAEAKKLVKEGATGVEEGEAGMSLLRAHRALPKSRPLIKFLSQDGIKVLLQNAENFYMQEQSKNMHLVDAPLLFTIDEKNRQVELSEMGVEFLSKGESDGNFFVMPDITLEMMEIEDDEELNEMETAEAKQLVKEGATGVEEGEAGMSLLRAHRALPKSRPLIKFLSQDGIKVLLQNAENFYMQEQSKNMHLVDAPLLFTIDEKNRQVELSEMGVEFLSKGESDGNFFVMPDITLEMMEIEDDEELNEMETAEAKQVLSQDFAVKSRRLHAVSQLLKAYTLFEKDEEYVVMDGEVKIVDEQTGRMMEGRRYSDGLHQALEAKENVKVGDITQTYATVTLQNYFRMYHKLAGMTGTAETEASELWEIYKLDVVVIPTNRPIARDDREDLVFKTEREKFNAVINDVVKLTEQGRPVLVGTTSVDISEKLSRMLQMKGIDHNVLNAKQHQREADIVAEAGRPGKVTIATNMAGRGTDIKISDEVKRAGGLAIIGTERHDSRRVDRQLRGRAGRQGDPGSSQFYISLEDKLMRLFQSERIAKLMDKMGHQDGEVIQHSMVSKSIERAQKKVEENNFGIRKRLLEYDDVMNIQREAIYKKRKNALSGERLSVDLNNMFLAITESLVRDHRAGGNFETFKTASFGLIGFDPKMEADTFQKGNEASVIEDYQQQFLDFYDKKSTAIQEVIMPVVKSVHENQGNYKLIAVPFTDGRTNPLPIAASIQEAVDTEGASVMRDIEKTVTLALIDDNWKEHLRSMDELKDSVQSASFEQKDPLVVYKMEAFNLFEGLVHRTNEEVTSYLSQGTLEIAENRSLQEAKKQETDFSKTQTNERSEDVAARKAAEGVGRRSKPTTFKRVEKKVGRNEPCPCGSGKKFKQCHGKTKAVH